MEVRSWLGVGHWGEGRVGEEGLNGGCAPGFEGCGVFF